MASENTQHLVTVLSEAHSEALNSLPSPLRESADGIAPSAVPDSVGASAVTVSPGSISPGNGGIQFLSTLADSMETEIQNQDVPLVLVPGFNGWGRPLFGTINYWGGFQDLPDILAKKGYTVILVKIGPLSSDRERACEIWAQLRTINTADVTRGYDLPDETPTSIGVNYGKAHPAERLGELQHARTWRPVIYGKIPTNWKWSEKKPVHFICHSQGGNSIRFLIELLKGVHQETFPGDDFPITNCQSWVKSVAAIGTPHKGTTVTHVVQNVLPSPPLEVITRGVWSTSILRPDRREYDLQLDHWGFYRKPNESLGAMHTRLSYVVPIWWMSNHHGFYDNSIPGVAKLSEFALQPSEDTYYFTMSFCATQPFDFGALGWQDISDFIALFPLDEFTDPLGMTARLVATILRLTQRLPFLPRVKDFTRWLTDVANRHLGSMGYFSRIPRPGNQIPRPDVLPILAFFAYAMGGHQLSNQESLILKDVTSDDFQKNDGVVNTISMIGPTNAQYSNNPAKGRYLHLGENATIDHADQIGVFTSEDTANEVTFMYLLLAHVMTRLT